MEDVAEFREAVWEAVPPGAPPERFDLRLSFLRAHVAAGERVLDLGCGEGDFAAALAADGCLPVGVDVSREALRRAEARHPALDLRLWPAGRPLPLEDGEADAVWAGEVVEHVVDPAGWLNEVRRVLRRGGLLLLTTPAHPRLRLARLALSRRAFDAHFSVRADHLRFFTDRSLRALLTDVGYDDVHVRRAGGPPLLPTTLLARARRP